jgi:hypothetical protein
VEVRRWREAHLKGREALADLQLRKLEAETELREIKLKRQNKTLLNRADVEAAFQLVVKNCTSKMDALGTKLAPVLIGLETIPEIKHVIDDAMREILTEIARADPTSRIRDAR